MGNQSKIIEENQKKPSRRKYIIAAGIIFLFILTGLIYRAITWMPVDSESQKASQAIIRQRVATHIVGVPKAGRPGIPVINNTAVRDKPKDPNTLTDEDFANVIALTFRDETLSEISLLEKCTNMYYLSMENISYPKSDIPSMMALLGKLNIIDLKKRFVIDLSPLENLTKLERVTLFGNPITRSPIRSIQPLANLTTLKYLRLTGTEVSDLKPISNLTNLQVLTISNNRISNLEPLRGLINIEKLIISEKDVSDLKPLRLLTNLQTLRIYGNKINNIESLKEMKNLETLQIESTELYDIESLKELTNLPFLGIPNCPNVTDEQVEELQKALPNLEIKR